jgi:hypothetical protein
MTQKQNRLCALSGIAYVVLTLGGALIAMNTGKTHDLTVGSSAAKLAAAVSQPAGTGIWIGAFMEMLGTAAFLVFAVWLAARLGGGLLGSIMRSAAAATAGATVVSLGLMDAISYRAGHGLTVPLAKTLVTVNEAMYVGTWFLIALVLVAAGGLALSAKRPRLAWSAFAIAAYSVVGAVSFDGAGQGSQLLWFVWAVCASVALVRREQAPAAAVAVA